MKNSIATGFRKRKSVPAAADRQAEVIIVGGGLAGLSAAIYLGRAKRDTLLIDEGKSMARWEPEVRNYLGFPDGIKGQALLERARRQARHHQIHFVRDRVEKARLTRSQFRLWGEKGCYRAPKLLLATGIFHIPPDIPGVPPCLGHSLFFCKDCDGYRVQGQAVGVYGWTNEAVDYALGLLLYSPKVLLVTDGRRCAWDRRHRSWVHEYQIPVFTQTIVDVRRHRNQIRAVRLEDGTEVALDAIFTTRGDRYYNKLARSLKAQIDAEGQIVVDLALRTTVPGLFAAGCVTPANCQMIIAAGQGAAAAQAINRELFEESLANHALRRFRRAQLRTRKTRPDVLADSTKKG